MSDGFLTDLATRYPNAGGPEAAIRCAARERLETARAYGLAGPPFDPHVLASLLNIKTRADRLSPGIDAMIVPDNDGNLTIVWDDRLPRKRTNFSVAHEIGHTLFPNCAQMVQYRQCEENANDQIEILCDIAAAEFLMPLPEFKADVAESGLRMGTLKRLSARYQASHEAIAIRMQYCSDAPAAMLVARMAPGSAPALSVHYAFANQAFRHALPNVQLSEGDPVPFESIMFRAYRAPLRQSFVRRECWNDQDSMTIQAMTLPSAPRLAPRVLALITPA